MQKVCLLTGASGRLGNAFCRQYGDRYRIAAVYRSKPPSVPSQKQSYVDPLDPQAPLPENEHPVFAIRANLSKDQEIGRVVELTLARFERIDLIVNAAVHSVWARMLDGDRLQQSCSAQFHMNVSVPLMLAVTVARDFWHNRHSENSEMNRNIVNISSTSGVRIYPDSGQSIYSASKAALNCLTRHMAEEFACLGVRVNAVAPDSFPEIVTTECVAHTIRSLDEGTLTGKVLVLDAEGECMT